MERQELFDRHVAELVDIVTNRQWDEYALLRSSAIVRALLLDDSPLLWQVNRQRRRRILFAVHTTPYEAAVMEHAPLVYGRGSGLSPRLAATVGSTVTLKLDDFLRYRVAVLDGHDIDVRSAVKFLSNVAGGVHPGTPKSEVEKALEEVDAGFGVGGVGIIAASMQGIADVVATACEPLTS